MKDSVHGVLYGLVPENQSLQANRLPMTGTERRDWKQYRSTGDVAVRNRLVERHLALVHHFAGRMKRRTRGALERDDLVSAGVVGLMNAVSCYDPGRGFRFPRRSRLPPDVLAMEMVCGPVSSGIVDGSDGARCRGGRRDGGRL